MKHILFTLFMFFLYVSGTNAAVSDNYIQYASNRVYAVEKVRYYDEYGRPVPPPPVYYDKYGRPVPPPRPQVDRRPAPPPPPPRHNVDRRPAPPAPASAPSYNIQVRPAPPPPPRR